MSAPVRSPLERFALAAIREWWNGGEPGDLGGDWVQDALLDFGLYVAVPKGTHFREDDVGIEGCENCEDGAYECGELSEELRAALAEGRGEGKKDG